MSIHNKWQALSMKDRAFLIREAVRNGITDIDSIRDTWEHRFDGLRDVVEKVNTSDKDFARRLRQEGRASIPDWEDHRRIATHRFDNGGESYYKRQALIDIANKQEPYYKKRALEDINNLTQEQIEAAGDRVKRRNQPLHKRFSDIFSDALSLYNPYSAKAMVAKASSPVVEEGVFDLDTAIKAVTENDEEARKSLQQANKTALTASINGAAMTAGYFNPYGIIGDLGITTASTLADTAVEGNTESLGKDLGINLAFDVAGGALQWLPKAIKGGKQVVKNMKSLNEDFVIRPSVPKVKAMLNHSPKWYNFPHGYELHFATATPKKYMGELFYVPALEKAKIRTAEVNKTPRFDMVNLGTPPKYETEYIRLEDKTLDEIMNEPISLYASASPTGVGGYDGQNGSNVDLSLSSLPSHTSAVHEKKHAVQRATNVSKADIHNDILGDYRQFPSSAVKTGYHKILADQADFLKELDTGLPPESKGAITELVFQTEGSRNLRELNATMTESLYKMFKNRLPSVDKRLMTKEILDLYKTELAQMTSEEFLKEFSKDANAYAADYVRGIKNIAKKDPGRAEYLTKRLKDLVINQYF